ncbi:MAG TPA: SCP2 sterol-binding domain-containing protein [Myxococcota bacterium]|jgi:putative sterol carrier protein|nr:SCP2 sterol-binding domain-containing protein [Myxococcota bacterium]
MPATDVKSVFEKTIPERLKSKPDVVAKVNSTYKFVITGDGGGTWVVDLTQPGGVVKAADSDAKCVITMGSGDFLDLINGKLNPQMAFMGGKLKVAGDMGLALKLGSLIG